MKKRISVIFILLAFMFTVSCLCNFVTVKTFADNSVDVLDFKSKAVYLVNPETNTVIFEKNQNEKLPIASMCKVMTLLICFDALKSKEISLDELIMVSENASSMGGSQVFLESNAEYLAGDLIKSIVVASANDACVAMAERLFGSEESFVEKMNEKARELSMNNTVFTNCTGLPKPGQYSSAKDVAIMYNELQKYEEYHRFAKIWTDKIIHPNNRETIITNTNKLSRFYEGCDGGKTGYTSEAGHCLVASAFRNAMKLICVVISAPDSKTRFFEVSSMFNYGFSNYVNKLMIDNKTPLDITVQVQGGKKESVEVVAERPIYIFTKKNEQRNVEIDFNPIENIKAPLHKGDCVGELNVYENGIEIYSVKVLANEDVLTKTYLDVIKDIGKLWGVL
ncbi:MAG: D-alanyl-D-alanine carboxypeptidase [Clostridia bacterium]|nr:D-alanyl-D-alanine carboxypeptidase [Clostridia bacterium]